MKLIIILQRPLFICYVGNKNIIGVNTSSFNLLNVAVEQLKVEYSSADFLNKKRAYRKHGVGVAWWKHITRRVLPGWVECRKRNNNKTSCDFITSRRVRRFDKRAGTSVNQPVVVGPTKLSVAATPRKRDQLAP